MEVAWTTAHDILEELYILSCLLPYKMAGEVTRDVGQILLQTLVQ